MKQLIALLLSVSTAFGATYTTPEVVTNIARGEAFTILSAVTNGGGGTNIIIVTNVLPSNLITQYYNGAYLTGTFSGIFRGSGSALSNVQPASANLTNWSLLSTNVLTGSTVFNSNQFVSGSPVGIKTGAAVTNLANYGYFVVQSTNEQSTRPYFLFNPDRVTGSFLGIDLRDNTLGGIGGTLTFDNSSFNIDFTEIAGRTSTMDVNAGGVYFSLAPYVDTSVVNNQLFNLYNATDLATIQYVNAKTLSHRSYPTNLTDVVLTNGLLMNRGGTNFWSFDGSYLTNISVALTNLEGVVTNNATWVNLSGTFSSGGSKPLWLTNVSNQGHLMAIGNDGTTNTFGFWESSAKQATFTNIAAYGSFVGNGIGLTNIQYTNIAGVVSTSSNIFSVINVQGVGATGDGTTDDTAAIQSAINLSTNSTLPSVVYFPPGRYKITSPLRIWPNDFTQNLGPRTGPTKLLGSGAAVSAIESYVTNGAAIDARIDVLDGPGLVGFTMERLGVYGPVGRGAWTNDASEGLALGRSNAVHWTGTNWITEGYGSQYYGNQIRIQDCDFSGFTKAIGSTNVWGFVVDGSMFHSNRLNALAFNCTHSISLRNVSVYGIAVSNRLTDVAIGFFAPREAPSWWGFGDTAEMHQTQVQWARVAVYNDELALTDIGGNYQFIDLGHQIRSGSRTNGSNVEIWRPYANIQDATYCDSVFPWVTNSPAMVELDSYVAPRVTFVNLIGDVCKNVRSKINIIGATTTGSGNNGTITFGTTNLDYPQLLGGASPWPALFNGSNVISLTKLTNSVSGITNNASGLTLSGTWSGNVSLVDGASEASISREGDTTAFLDFTLGDYSARQTTTNWQFFLPLVGDAVGLTNFTFDSLQTFSDITNTGGLYNSGAIVGFGGLNIRGGNVIATNGTATFGDVSGTFTGNGSGLTNLSAEVVSGIFPSVLVGGDGFGASNVGVSLRPGADIWLQDVVPPTLSATTNTNPLLTNLTGQFTYQLHEVTTKGISGPGGSVTLNCTNGSIVVTIPATNYPGITNRLLSRTLNGVYETYLATNFAPSFAGDYVDNNPSATDIGLHYFGVSHHTGGSIYAGQYAIFKDSGYTTLAGTKAGFSSYTGVPQTSAILHNSALFGSFAGVSILSGTEDSIFGAQAAMGRIYSSKESIFGMKAAGTGTAGLQNAIFGAYAGRTPNTTNACFFGYYAGNNDYPWTNVIAIGAFATNTAHNQTVIGNTNTTATFIAGNVNMSSLSVPLFNGTNILLGNVANSGYLNIASGQSAWWGNKCRLIGDAGGKWRLNYNTAPTDANILELFLGTSTVWSASTNGSTLQSGTLTASNVFVSCPSNGVASPTFVQPVGLFLKAAVLVTNTYSGLTAATYYSVTNYGEVYTNGFIFDPVTGYGTNLIAGFYKVTTRVTGLVDNGETLESEFELNGVGKETTSGFVAYDTPARLHTVPGGDILYFPANSYFRWTIQEVEGGSIELRRATLNITTP